MKIIEALKALFRGVLGLFSYVEKLIRDKTDKFLIFVFVGLILYHLSFLSKEGTISLQDFTSYAIAFGVIQLHYKFGRRERQIEEQSRNVMMLNTELAKSEEVVVALEKKIDVLSTEVRVLQELINQKNNQLHRNSKYITHLETRLEILEKNERRNQTEKS